MAQNKIYPVTSEVAARAHLDRAGYDQMYKLSVENPEAFWAEQATTMLDWVHPWQQVKEEDMLSGHCRWFQGGEINVSYNCIDRHLKTKGDQTAIIWESDNPAVHKKITYKELHASVCRLANVLKDKGVNKGDLVCIYMPMIPEAAFAMLACARIGAVHSVVFGGFSSQALRNRILDSGSQVVITADESVRGGRTIALKENVDEALKGCPEVHTVVVVRHTKKEVPWQAGRDLDYAEATAAVEAECCPEPMAAEAPLFILYTSGSTGQPKGVQHTTAGYLLQASLTHKYVFDYHEGDVYWCTADVGWVTGHSYVVYGPLANGAITLMFEGVPNWPDASRCWQIVDKHQVNIFYTAPTAIRHLMREGDTFLENTKRESLKLLGTVGEPTNPEAWEWYYRAVGQQKCPIVDTWWQTETGAIMITPLPGAIGLKPGSATLPFFGVQPALLDVDGQEIVGAGQGYLVMKSSWPGQLRTIYGNHQRMIDTYFSQYPGYYFTGDGARRDEDGYYWITGRVDDVLNVSGHRLSTAEVESALTLHEAVSEAAVVSCPHDVKGEGIYAYVTLMAAYRPTDEIKQALIELVRREIGPIAKPDHIQWAPSLPKTRSGKIMRRILRKVAAQDTTDFGDTSTLSDPAVVDELIRGYQAAAMLTTAS